MLDACLQGEDRSEGCAMDLSRFKLEITSDFDFMGAEYRRLFENSDASAFQHPLWLHHVRRRLCPDSAVAVATARTENGSLCLAHPLVRRSFGPLSCLDTMDGGVSDYNCLVYDSSLVPTESAWRLLSAAIRPRALCRIRRIRADALVRVPRARWSFMGFHAHGLGLYGPFDDWRSKALPSRTRKMLDQKRRRLSRRARAEFRLETSPDRIVAVLEAIRAYRTRRFGNDPLRSDTLFRFYTEVAVAGQQMHLTRTFGLYMDGQLVAGLFGLCHDRSFLFLLLGFSPDDAWNNCSIGLITLEDAIRHSVAAGDTTFDLTIGDEAYKALFAPTRTAMHTAWMGNPVATLAAAQAYSCIVARRRRSAADPA